ncbi:MAG: glycosyltransferase, partial [Bacteroidales bacterium]|nr:glycosyltransferase [Bacteroidales bacterium]
MNNTPLVSIITVCFNAEKTIEQTIQSVINQTYSNIEYIIIDGKSTDSTLNIVSKYKDNIATIISEPDNGIYDAMNKGIKLSSGELIGIINADDWYEKDAVKIMVNKYLSTENKDNSLYYGMIRIWKNNKEYCVR